MFGINRKHMNGEGSTDHSQNDSNLIKYFGTEFHKERSLTELNWELVIFLRVTFSGLHREKLIAFFLICLKKHAQRKINIRHSLTNDSTRELVSVILKLLIASNNMKFHLPEVFGFVLLQSGYINSP